MKVRLTRKIWNATKFHSLSCRGDLIPLCAVVFFFCSLKSSRKNGEKKMKSRKLLINFTMWCNFIHYAIICEEELRAHRRRNEKLCMLLSTLHEHHRFGSLQKTRLEKSQQPTTPFNGSREAAIIELFVIQQDASAEIWNWKIIQFLHRHKRVSRRARIDETWRERRAIISISNIDEQTM